MKNATKYEHDMICTMQNQCQRHSGSATTQEPRFYKFNIALVPMSDKSGQTT